MKASAEQWGEVVDQPFPHVEPEWGAAEIIENADRVVQAIVEYSKATGDKHAYVDGHAIMAAAIVSALQASGIECHQVRSPRDAKQNDDGSTTYQFNFEGWREWPRIGSIEVAKMLRPARQLPVLSKMAEVLHYDAARSTDICLDDDHRTVHAWMAAAAHNSGFIHPPTLIQKLHDNIVHEFISRGQRHYVMTDMDRQTVAALPGIDLEKYVNRMQHDVIHHDQGSDLVQLAGTTLTYLAKARVAHAVTVLKAELGKSSPIDFKPMKPWNRLIDLRKDIDDVRTVGEAVIQPKFDGVRFIVVRKSGRVSLLAGDTLIEKANALPELVSQLRGLDGGDIIIDAEAVLMKGSRGDGFDGHSELLRVLDAKDIHARQGDVKLLVFDCMMHAGNDLRDLSYDDRLQVLAKYMPTDNIDFIDASLRIDPDDKIALQKAIDVVSRVPGSEGAMIKDLVGIYGESKSWYVFKSEQQIDALIIEKRRVGNSWTYGLAIGPISAEWADGIALEKAVTEIDATGLQLGDMRGDTNPPLPVVVKFDGKYWMVAGRAFNTSLDKSIGDVIRVAVQHVLEHDVGEFKKYTTYLPRPIDSAAVPDSIDVARKLAAVSMMKKMKPVLGAAA